eukprot:6555692-Prymnesium_polylepis.1
MQRHRCALDGCGHYLLVLAARRLDDLECVSPLAHRRQRHLTIPTQRSGRIADSIARGADGRQDNPSVRLQRCRSIAQRIADLLHSSRYHVQIRLQPR